VFICVINNQTVRWCQSVDMVQDMVTDCIACLPKGPSITPVTIEVYARIGTYTTKTVENRPKEKSWEDSGCPCCEPPTVE